MKSFCRIFVLGSLLLFSITAFSSNKIMVAILINKKTDKLLDINSDEPVSREINGQTIWFANLATWAAFRKEEFNRVTNQNLQSKKKEKSSVFLLSWLGCWRNNS